MTARKIPVGVQSFENLITGGYLYADKTGYIRDLVEMGRVFFLSRPRRFGKSLLVSTMEAYFRGRKELFHGLAIEQYENAKGPEAWTEYPVICFSLSGGDYNAPHGLEDILSGVIQDCVRDYGLTGKYAISGRTLPQRFKTLLERLYAKTGHKVVVLVDEYDKPLLETMYTNAAQEEKNRQFYKSFFSVLKDEDDYLQFVFFTGVTRFSKVSIFSDLNQLNDISMMDDMSGICGISENELTDIFMPEVQEMAAHWKITSEECLRRLAQMYDGYHFSANGIGVYNPFSLLNAVQKKNFGYYWFGTGTPTFVINKLKKSGFRTEQFVNGVQATEMSLQDYTEENPDPIPLFYQSGYLTIAGWNPRFQVYDLKFPNDEVEYGFMNSLVNSIMPGDQNRPGFFVMNFITDLESGNIPSFMERLTAVFASIPYTETAGKNYENEWRNEIYLILALMGMNVNCEVHTAQGRADCIVETDQFVYLFEFKLDKSAEEALRQIDEKGYADSYLSDSRKICRIGVNFSSEKRNISQWVSR